jgi:hypothetical protein
MSPSNTRRTPLFPKRNPRITDTLARSAPCRAQICVHGTVIFVTEQYALLNGGYMKSARSCLVYRKLSELLLADLQLESALRGCEPFAEKSRTLGRSISETVLAIQLHISQCLHCAACAPPAGSEHLRPVMYLLLRTNEDRGKEETPNA